MTPQLPREAILSALANPALFPEPTTAPDPAQEQKAPAAAVPPSTNGPTVHVQGAVPSTNGSVPLPTGEVPSTNGPTAHAHSKAPSTNGDPHPPQP
jgi:hypothetical protein